MEVTLAGCFIETIVVIEAFHLVLVSAIQLFPQLSVILPELQLLLSFFTTLASLYAIAAFAASSPKF